MRHRSIVLVAAAASLVVGLDSRPAAARKLRVVATSTTFATLVDAVGGDRVETSAVAPPCDDIHFIEPRPSDILKLARADAFVHAGLDLELWRGPLVEAARNRALFPGAAGDIDLSMGVQLLEIPDRRMMSRAEGDIHVFGNPHYWMDPDNIPIMTRTIADKLATLAPDGAAVFATRRDAFLEEVAAADRRWREALASFTGAALVPYHRDWPYLAAHFDLKVLTWLEPKPNVPPSARHLQAVIGMLRAHSGTAVIVREPFHPEKTCRTVAAPTGAVVAVLAQHAGCLPGTEDYISLMNQNVASLTAALRQASGAPGPR